MNTTVRASLLEFRSKQDVPAVGAAIVDAHGNVVVDVVGTTRRGGAEPVTERRRAGTSGRAASR